MILRDEQIGCAVVVVVAGDDGARIFELNFVEADVGGDVFESVGTEIAEESDFALAVGSFADGDEIDPAVVVVVEGGDAVGAGPVGGGQRNLLELAVIVAPESQAGCSPVGEGEVHPAVVVEVEDSDPCRRPVQRV